MKLKQAASTRIHGSSVRNGRSELTLLIRAGMAEVLLVLAQKAYQFGWRCIAIFLECEVSTLQPA